MRQSWSRMIRCPAQARNTCFDGIVVENVIVTISVTVSPVPLPRGDGSVPVKTIVAVDDGVQLLAIELPGPKTRLGLLPTPPDGSSVVVPESAPVRTPQLPGWSTAVQTTPTSGPR